MITPLETARLLTRKQPLTRFFSVVEDAGRDLARLNVTPGDVTRALQICETILQRELKTDSFHWMLEQLGFCTILALNHAYYEVREAESRAFYQLFHIEVESSNIDVLFRRFLETMAEGCGAAAGHLFVFDELSARWELKASTARAASRQTLAIMPAPASIRRALSKAAQINRPNLVLDNGWNDLFPCIWSVPMPGGGVMQFGFEADRMLFPRELELLAAAGERCHAAAHKTRLLEDVASREQQLRQLAIRMLMVEENERRRISRELHDDAGQSLVVIRLQMEMIELAMPPDDPARERLAEARDLTEKTILDIRRLISDLSPAVLEQLGLGAAIRQLVNRFSRRYQCEVSVRIGELPVLDSNYQLVIYRLAQECFNNIEQHSKADTVNISISTADRVLRLSVEDNGVGFHVDDALGRKDCFGLEGIRERVAVLGGKVEIISTPKVGHRKAPREKTGTIVQIELPIP